jgi:hypothetical protein
VAGFQATPVGSLVIGATVGATLEMLVVRTIAPLSVNSQMFFPAKCVIPLTTSSTSPSDTSRVLLVGM